jgi:broad specificity phosphatase PhoE
LAGWAQICRGHEPARPPAALGGGNRPLSRTLARWRAGDLGRRFPGGESGSELAARIGRALGVIAGWADPKDAIVIAHGASIRSALPALTGQPDPGADLATGGLARLVVAPGCGSAIDVALAAWT